LETIKAIRPNTGSVSAVITLPALKYLSGDREWLAITIPYKTLARFIVTSAVKKKNVEIIKSEIKNRFLDPKHTNEIKNYIREEPKYTIPPITLVSYDRLPFIPISFNDDDMLPGETDRDLLESRGSLIGLVQVPLDTEFECLDGNHRTVAIRELANESPELIADSNMLLNIVYETSKRKIRQDFVDVNATAKHTSSSINTLFNTRDQLSRLVADIIDDVAYLADTTELLATSVSKNSKDIFTINNIKSAIIELCGFNSQAGSPSVLSERLKDDVYYLDAKQEVTEFFNLLKNNSLVSLCLSNREKTPEIRSNSVITSGTGLVVAARVGGFILNEFDDTNSELVNLFALDWTRANPLFNGRIIIGDQKILNSREAITATAIAIKKQLGYPLSEAELLKL